MSCISLKNNQTINLHDIPEMEYLQFLEFNTKLVSDINNHCVSYFAYPSNGKLNLICCIANDENASIRVSSSFVEIQSEIPSFSEIHPCFEKFEREIHENFGISYNNHPWLKPLRYSHNRFNLKNTIENYPFFSIESDELHEVGVGPIHAGVIEPGHFRFICNGEQIQHLEIQLGYQHRGIEKLFVEKKKLLQRATLAESIAGDTVVGHSVAFANLWESLCEYPQNQILDFSRTIALELERIAIHTGDLAAICADIAYQLGNAVYGRLRTPFVNFFQEWCGNRLAKGLIRPGKINYPFTNTLVERLNTVIDTYLPDFIEMSNTLFRLPSALSRLEKTGVVSNEEVKKIGTVGMAAKMSGVLRDIRKTHPYNSYVSYIQPIPVVKRHGDVYSRTQIRREEILQSAEFVKSLINNFDVDTPKEIVQKTNKARPNSFSISLVEGWRGEICHCAITDEQGEIILYKIKDPSHHNWMALSQSVRNNDISDFPICNKSFNLSYCGHDL